MDYPITLSMERPESSSRLHLLFAPLIAIPNFIILILKMIGVGVVSFIATLAILFTGKYPSGMWDFVSKTMVYSIQLTAYLWHLTDVKPTSDPNTSPLKIEVQKPETIMRRALLVGPTVAAAYMMILGAFYMMGYAFCSGLAFWAILFTGKYPTGFWNYNFGMLKFTTRVSWLSYLLTDQIPPYDLK